MSQSSDAGRSRRRGKYAVRACNSCRRRKCKCDGNHPMCQPCAVSGYECTWTPDAEEERPVTKQLVEALRAKAHQLEVEISLLKQADARVAPSSSAIRQDAEIFHPLQLIAPPESQSHADIDLEASLRDDHVLRQLPHQAFPQPHSAAQLNLSLSPSQSNINTNPTSEVTGLVSQEAMEASIDQKPPLKYQYIFNIDTSLPLNEQSLEDQASLRCEWNRYLPSLDTIQLSRHEHDTLLSRCFNYSAGWLFGILSDLFLCDMLELLSPNPTHNPKRLHHYSPILHCSLLAFASPMSDNPKVQQQSTREKFATRAKHWLDQEFNHPNPSLIISLILLSEYHLGIGERNTGYMYSGMSMRAARAGTSSPLRDWYGWSAFVQERLVAQEMHRPGEMAVPTAPITLPIATEPSEEPISEAAVLHLFEHEKYAIIALECFVQCAKLMLITNAIPAASRGNLSTNDIHTQLETWFNSLPVTLLVQQSNMLTPPPILALHIHYWWSILQLCIPESTTEHGLSINLALVKLVELFEAFDTQFGLRYFPRNLVKALHLCGRASILEHLPGAGIDICLKGLRIWPCANRMVADLLQLRSSMDSEDDVGRVES